MLGRDRRHALGARHHHSVRRLVDELPAEAAVYPTHGFGSFCASTPASGADGSTVGQEAATNPALTQDEQDYVDTLFAGLGAFPTYYARMGPANAAGPSPVDLTAPEPVDPAELRRRLEAGQWVIDLPERTAFAAGHPPGSLRYELATPFVTYFGWTFDFDAELTLIGETPTPAADAHRGDHGQAHRQGDGRGQQHATGRRVGTAGHACSPPPSSANSSRMLAPVLVTPPWSNALRYSRATDFRCSLVIVCVVTAMACSPLPVMRNPRLGQPHAGGQHSGIAGLCGGSCPGGGRGWCAPITLRRKSTVARSRAAWLG